MARGRSDGVLGPLRVLLETGSAAGLTDGQLLERFASRRDGGSETAFAALVSRHGPMVLGVCRHWLRDDHAADDAFQAVFLVLARRAGSIRQPELLSAWLYGVAVRIARKARKQAGRREGREVAMSETADAYPVPEPGRLEAEEVAAVHEEVGRLPDRYRRAVVLCHFEGLTHAEAAVRLGCAPGTVGSLVSRARDMLRGRLARRGFSSGAVLLAGALEPKAATAAVPPALEQATIRAALIFTTNPAATAGIASAAAVALARGALHTMSLIKLTVSGVAMLALGSLAAGAGGFLYLGSRPDGPVPAPAQVQPLEKPGPVTTPGLPGAVTKPPPWLIKDAPFDVAAFLAAPPPDENAASRYLEALFEFGTEVAVCFPEGPEREGRKRAVEVRLKRFWEIDRALRAAPNSVPAAQIDAMLDAYGTGFRKLDWAQQRPRCVFRTAISVTAQIPHVQTARLVARLAALKVRREIERGEIGAALRDLARQLRLSRDLLPRGIMITDLVAASMDGSAAGDMIVPLLAVSGLTIAHCDRLLTLLAEHEARSIDPYIEGLRAEYLINRVTLHDLVYEQDWLRREQERLGNNAGPSIVAEIAEPTLFSAMGANVKMPQPDIGQRLKAAAERFLSLKNIPDLDALMARTTPEELAQQVEKLGQLHRSLEGASGVPYLERIRKSAELPPSLNALDFRTRITRGLLGATSSFVGVLARWKAMMRVSEGLVAVRRWQLDHGGAPPPSLAAAMNEAGWPRVPIDPYDDRPMRFAIIDGRPTVYSIGQDGRDDGGKIDNARSPDSGDVLLQLPKP